MTRRQTIHKAVVALLSGVVTLVTMFTGVAADFIGPEAIAGIGTVVTTLLVWLVPNKDVTASQDVAEDTTTTTTTSDETS